MKAPIIFEKVKKRGREGGFTLLEVVMAMAIFLIGILATMQMGFMSIRNVTSGNIVTQASLLAQAEIEKIKHTPNVRTLINDFCPAGNNNPATAVLPCSVPNPVQPVDGNGNVIPDSGLFSVTYSFIDPINATYGVDPGTGAAVISPSTGDPVVGNNPNCRTGTNDGGSGVCLAVVIVSWQRGLGGRGGGGQVEMHTLTHGDGI